MFDAKKILKAIGPTTLAQINASSLPKTEVMTLLHIWQQGSPKRLRELAAADKLMPKLKGELRQGLFAASEVRMHNAHLTQAECLQQAGLPLTL